MDAIIKLIDDWSMAIDQKKSFLAIFFDFAKAFDLVDHEKLLNKLRKLLPEWLVSWIASYLTNRKQRVSMNGTETEWKQVEAGILTLPKEADIEKYADDILSQIIGKACSELPQEIINGVQKWCAENKMRLNTNKCKIVFSPGKDTETPPSLCRNDTELQVVESYRYLGIEINNRLDWGQQWEHIEKNTSHIPFLIKQLKRLGFNKEIW